MNEPSGSTRVALSQGALSELSDPEPKITLSNRIRGWIRSIIGSRIDTSLREALEETIEEHEELTEHRLPPEERVMLHNVLSFGDINVNDIMTQRADIEAVPSNQSLDGLKNHIITHGHTRIPVYEESLDNIRGFVHAKDLLPMLSGDVAYSLESIIRPPLFVPPSMRIIDLLFKMRNAGSHLAIVVDEYGGTDGLVSMEDVLEEIVGEIHDEHDEEEDLLDKISKISPGVYEVSARITIDKLEKELDLNLVAKEDDGEFETLGGLIFFQLGHIPAKGEIVDHASGLRFEVIEADTRRIHKVRIHTA